MLKISFPEVLFSFHFVDSFNTKTETIANNTGTAPTEKAIRQSDTKLLIAPAVKNPTGMPTDKIPNATARFFSDHISEIKIVVVTSTPQSQILKENDKRLPTAMMAKWL